MEISNEHKGLLKALGLFETEALRKKFSAAKDDESR